MYMYSSWLFLLVMALKSLNLVSSNCIFCSPLASIELWSLSLVDTQQGSSLSKKQHSAVNKRKPSQKVRWQERGDEINRETQLSSILVPSLRPLPLLWFGPRSRTKH